MLPPPQPPRRQAAAAALTPPSCRAATPWRWWRIAARWRVAAALGPVGPGGRLGALGLAPLVPPTPRDDDDDNYAIVVIVVVVVVIVTEDDAATIANTDVAIAEDDNEDRRAAANNDDCIRASHGAVVGLNAAVGRGRRRRGADVRGAGIACMPRIGDVVRYYDVDGGRADGQVLVGKILLIQSITSSSPSSSSPSSSLLSSSDGTNRWLVEVIELEDVGDGYYAEYPYCKRPRPALHKLEDLLPLPALYVRSESAYKVPLDGRGLGTGRPLPSHPGYNLAGYDAPVAMSVADADVGWLGVCPDQAQPPEGRGHCRASGGGPCRCVWRCGARGDVRGGHDRGGGVPLPPQGQDRHAWRGRIEGGEDCHTTAAAAAAALPPSCCRRRHHHTKPPLQRCHRRRRHRQLHHQAATVRLSRCYHHCHCRATAAAVALLPRCCHRHNHHRAKPQPQHQRHQAAVLRRHSQAAAARRP
jgi:hypothetical protein